MEEINEFTATTGNLTTTIVNHIFKVLGLAISFFSRCFLTNANNVQPFLIEWEALN